MRNSSIAERFDTIVRKHANRLAIHDLGRQLTYRELAEWVARLRAAVIKLTAPGDPVATLLPTDVRAAVAVLGVLTAGRGIMPLDATHPMERNRAIAKHAQAKVVIAAGALAARARKLFGAKARVIDIDALSGRGARAPAIDPEGLAWILYTSGSTGVPKGVYQNHRGLLQDIDQATVSLRYGAQDPQALFYSVASIAGLRVVLGSLLVGGALHMLSPRKLGAPRLAHEVERRGITMFRSSATLFRHVMGALKPGERFNHLRTVSVGGDYVLWADFDAFKKCCPPTARFFCTLGSTECSTIYAQWAVDESARPGGPLLPVGRAIARRIVDLIDDEGRGVSDGETGEIAVSGRDIALGYWREPELTARSFSSNAHNPRLRTFRTGDLGRRRPDGLLEFIGRKDLQIKLYGFRVELGEIEGALRSCTGVCDAAMVVRRNKDGNPRSLAAYVQLQDGVQGLLPRHMKMMLEPRLPQHMIPADIYIVGELPWLTNFKVDRKRLEEMDRKRVQASAKADDPVTAQVAAIFRNVLKVAQATPEDSVATLGGDSLQAVDIMLRLEERMGIAVPERTFRTSQSIGELARWITSRRAKAKPARPRKAGG